MSFRRDVQKLTDSTKWARIQGKFQYKDNYNNTRTLSYVPQKGSLQYTKEDFGNNSCKSNENAIIEDSKKYLEEETAINGSNSLGPQSKQIDTDVRVKIHANSLAQSHVKNIAKSVNTDIDTNDNLSDCEITGNRQTFATKTFSEIIGENLRLLSQKHSSANKIKREMISSQNEEVKKNDTSSATHDNKLVERWLNDNYNETSALSVNSDQHIKNSQQISKPCHKETMAKLQCSHLISHDKILEDEMLKYVLSEELCQKNLASTRRNTKGITPLHINNIERRKTFRHSCLSRPSFRERRRCQRSKITVKNLIHKFEKISNESIQETKDNESCGGSIKEQCKASLDIHPLNESFSDYCKEKIHHVKVVKNRDDSGISEGEESMSPKHINQTFNFRLIESYNRHLNKINAENNTFQDSMIKNFVDYVPNHIYSNLCTGRMCREAKQLRFNSPRPNFIAKKRKKPIPSPRSLQSPHYFHISDWYSGCQYQQRDIAKKKCESSGSKLSQSEEEWADISEEEKEVISYSQKLANASKKFYDVKLPIYCSESVNLYDCCSSTRERMTHNTNNTKEDDNADDSSWETVSLHQQDEDDDGDKSSTTSSEHHYEAINDFLKFEPPDDLTAYRSDQQNPDDFIRESFNFLDTHSADESDDIDSPSATSIDSHPLQNNYRYSKKRLNTRDKLSPSIDSRDSITESILMYQELSSFRRSFNNKTFKNILKENSLESNKLKKQSLFSKNSKEILNFHVPWFSKTDHNQKLSSYENVPEQLDISSQKLKEKKKGKYFTLPNPKKMSRSEQHLYNLNLRSNADVPKSFNSTRRASDSSPFSSGSKAVDLTEDNQTKSTCHECCGNENSLQSQSSSATNESEGNRGSLISCASCMDDYICRKHLESTRNSSSSSEESINCLRAGQPIDVQFIKVRKRAGSTGSEHSYFQITQIPQPLIDEENAPYEQVLVNDQNNNNANGNEEQNNSELYCDLNHREFHELPSELPHMSIEELSFLSQNGEKKQWSDLLEVQKSGVIENMSAQELKLQEAIFNVAIFEATYLRLLETYQEHFVRNSSNSDVHSLCRLISWHEWHLVFSDSLPIIEISKRLIADIELRWVQSYICFDITDILYEDITTHFHAYVKYCSNKPYRDRMLKVLMNTKPKFAEATRNLEASSVCQGLLLHEFLMLPINHISDLLILLEEIFHWLPSNSSKCNTYNEIMVFLRKLKLECEKGALQMERMEEMLLLTQQIIFKDCKPLSLISASRWLLKRGEMTHLICDVLNKRTFGKNVRWSKVPVYIFLFNDYLIVTKRRSDENYNVLDYCPKDIVHAEFIDDMTSISNLRPPSNYKNLLQLKLWSNHEHNTVEMILNCPSESDKIRWEEALISDEVTDSDIVVKQGNSHVQCIQPYTAQEADELTLFESDIVKILKKVSDGWYKGKHVRDGNMGWFPAACVTEINILDFKLSQLSLGHKYSQVSTTSPKIPISPK